jgi:hypothetical protein
LEKEIFFEIDGGDETIAPEAPLGACDRQAVCMGRRGARKEREQKNCQIKGPQLRKNHAVPLGAL